jgi:hypothetical protein
MPSPRIVVLVLAVMIVCGVARARAEDPPPPVDAARQNERYVIEPGAEPLIGDMLGVGQTLPGGCTFSDGKIEPSSVVATYTCGDGEVVLQLVHPASAPSGNVGTQRFAITVTSGAPPAGLVEAVAARIRTRETAFQWTEVSGTPGGPAQRTRWPRVLAGGAVAAILAFWAWRRRARQRERSP